MRPAPQDKKPQLTLKQLKVLREQTISEDGPGTIGRDFETLLRFVAEREVPVSGTNHLLSIKLLPALNEQMARPLDVRLQRPQLKSFPHLNGLYLLLRASGLARLETVGKQRLLRLDEAALTAWRGLNPTERYFNLLETWLGRANEEIIGERGPLSPLFKCLSFLQRLTPAGMPVAGTPDEAGLRYYPGLHNLALLEAFGLMTIEHGTPEPGHGWRIERVTLTPWGSAVFALLTPANTTLNNLPFMLGAFPPLSGLLGLLDEADRAAEEAELEEDDALNEPPLGQWQPLFQPYFPQWQQNLVLPAQAMPAGVAVFKVVLGRVWRRIAIPTRLTLDELSASILQAFDFDDDHLYLFAYQNRFGTTVEVHHPYMEEPPSTSQVTIGQLPLRAGDSLRYVFDFGDYWEFDILLEELKPPEAKMKQPKVLESHGKAPAQYPNWDDQE